MCHMRPPVGQAATCVRTGPPTTPSACSMSEEATAMATMTCSRRFAWETRARTSTMDAYIGAAATPNRKTIQESIGRKFVPAFVFLICPTSLPGRLQTLPEYSQGRKEFIRRRRATGGNGRSLRLSMRSARNPRPANLRTENKTLEGRCRQATARRISAYFPP